MNNSFLCNLIVQNVYNCCRVDIFHDKNNIFKDI